MKRNWLKYEKNGEIITWWLLNYTYTCKAYAFLSPVDNKSSQSATGYDEYTLVNLSLPVAGVCRN